MAIAVDSDLALPRDPQSALHAATKQYVDNLVTGLSPKDSVRVATTANITIATALNSGDAIDGITLADGDRVLVKNQSAAAENGIYVAGASPARATDMDAWAEVPGAAVFVEQGSTQADTLWVSTADTGGTLGTTAITWTQFSSVTDLIAGGGIGKSGNTLSVAAGTALIQDADGLSIDTSLVARKNQNETITGTRTIDVGAVVPLTLDRDTDGNILVLNRNGSLAGGISVDDGAPTLVLSAANGLSLLLGAGAIEVNGARITELADPTAATDAVPRSFAGRVVTGTFGDGSDTTPTFTHNLNTTNVLCMVLNESTKKFELAEWTADTANTVTFTYITAPATNSKRAVVIGIQN